MTLHIYRTVEGDMLDRICKIWLGSEAHAPAVLELNPRLADMGPVLPVGIEIRLPDTLTATDVTAAPSIRLWGAA